MDYRYLIVLAAALAVLALRLTTWRSDAGARPFTLLLALLTVAVVLNHPAVMGSRWPFDGGGIHLANWTNILSDLVVLTACGIGGVLVARAWRAERLVPYLIGGLAAVMIALIVLWQISAASRVPTRHVSELGGPATGYAALSASVMVASGLAVCASVALARGLHTRLRVALISWALAAAASALVGLIHLVSVLGHPGQPYDDPPLATLFGLFSIVFFIVTGLLDHLLRRSSRRGPAPDPRRVTETRT